MKLIRFGELGAELPGLVMDDTTRVDVSAFVPEYDEEFFASDGLSRLKEWLSRNAASAPRVSPSVRLGSPISRPSKIVCIGLNFRDHARESNLEIPSEPVIFFKASTSLTGPNDDVILPKNAQKVDWEIELAVVIGQKCRYIEREEALEYVAGYVLHNDYSERVFQLERGGQWVKGKSADTFAPLGPFLAKSFATTVSPWVVTLDALEPFRVPAYERPAEDPPPLPYLAGEDDQRRVGFIRLDRLWLNVTSSALRCHSDPALKSQRFPIRSSCCAFAASKLACRPDNTACPTGDGASQTGSRSLRRYCSAGPIDGTRRIRQRHSQRIHH